MARPSFDVSIVTSGHDVADARLHREVGAMLRAGLRVEMLGLGRGDDGPPGATVRAWPRGGMSSRALRAFVFPMRARGRVLLAPDPDSLLGALVVGRLRRRAVVADVHEDYVALLDDRAWARGVRGRVARLLARGAVVAAARADLTVVADEHLAPSTDSARHRLVLRNLPDTEPVPAGSATVSTAGAAPRAVYVGDLRRSRGLRTMVEAIAAAPGWELDLIGPVHRDDAGWLEDRTAQSDLRDRLRLHGRRPPAAAWEVAAGADVGLVLLDDTPAFRDAMPSKLHEYLAHGLAVLATPLPRVAALVEESGAGRVVADAEAAAACLRAWAADPQDLDGHRRAASSWATQNVNGRAGYDELAKALVELAAP